MDIELNPPHGITGFPLGMAAEQVKAAAAELGRVKVQDDGSADRSHYMKVTALHPQFEIVFHLEDGATLTAAEVWIPRPGTDEISVRFRDVDVFRTPARKVLELLREMGFTVLDETLYAYVPHLSLSFTRVSGHEVPLDSDGEPLHFQAVLTGPTGYYDFMVTES
ncbi:hypothetical protein [Streptomyces sp. NPDC007100]|uniref:hypothetical protein n=1 Tax=Streptomyces sp. NPDC007100 TaxID=3155602 RepID=UPI0033E9FAA0